MENIEIDKANIIEFSKVLVRLYSFMDRMSVETVWRVKWFDEQ